MRTEDFFSLNEHRLLKAAQSTIEAPLLLLLGGAGLRVSEAGGFESGIPEGPGECLHVVDGKGGKLRTSILPKPVLEALQAHIDGQEGPRYGPYLH